MTTRVLILMGSDSDVPVMKECARVLRDFSIAFEMRVCSAHRSPAVAAELATQARGRGVQVIVAAAGLAAHLAGVVAAHTTLPVIGVPLESGALHGMDSLYSTVMMPGGIPVATVAVGKPGARNAGILAVQILAVADESLADELTRFRQRMTDEVIAKDARLQEKLPELLD